MEVAKKKDVWHLVRQGRILQPHIDTETNSLKGPLILEYARAMGDMAGNFTGSSHITVKRPDEYLGDPRAFIVTRTNPYETTAEGRDPFPVAMGKIAWEYQRAVKEMEKLPLEHKEAVFETVTKRGKGVIRTAVVEDVMEYPLTGEDGKKVNDVRYHPKREKFSYRVDDDPRSPYYESVTNNFYQDADGSKWKFTDIHLQTGGWNVKRADLSWLRLNFVRAGFHPSNLFFHYSRSTLTNKQLQKGYVVDAARATLAAHAFGPQDEAGVKIGMRVDPATGAEVPSVKLGLVMAANTRDPNPQRGIEGGVLMPDGSQHNDAKAHRNVAYDAEASYQMYIYDRKRAPEIIRQVELQADEQELRRVLAGGADPEMPPIYGLLRRGYPMTYPLADPVTPLLPDDQLGQLRRVPVVRLDRDLDAYTWRNKTLKQMTPEEIAGMIEEAPRHEAVIRLEPVRHWSGLIPLSDSLNGIYKGGDGERADMFDTVNAAFRYTQENEEVLEKIYAAVEIIGRRQSHKPDPMNPLMEEQGVRNGFGDLDYWEQEAKEDAGRRRRGEGGAVSTVAETIYNRAMDVYNHFNKTDAMLHSLAIQPHPVDWSSDDEALSNFRDTLRRVRQKIRKKIYAHQEVKFLTPEGAPVPVTMPKVSAGSFEFTAEVKSPLLAKMQAENRLVNPTPEDKALLRAIVNEVREKIMEVAAGEEGKRTKFRLDAVQDGGKSYRVELQVTPQQPSAYRNLLENDPWVTSFIKGFKPGTDDNEKHAEKAREFRWTLAKRLLDDDYAARTDPKSTYGKNNFDYECMTQGQILFANPSRNFHVVDSGGREIDFGYMREQHAQFPNQVINKLDSGEWRIQFHRLSAVPSVSATLARFAHMEKLDELPAHWRKEHELHMGHILYGPPGVDPDEHRWPTIPQIERVIERLEINAKSGNREELARIFGDFSGLARGDADIYMKHEESHRILADMKKLVNETKAKYPFREEFNRAANYDPASGLPFEWIQHEVDSRNVVVINVPDTHLRRPLDDMTAGSPYSLVAHVDAAQRAKIDEGAEVVLRGAQTGRLYYGGPAAVREAPQEQDGYKDYYRAADKAYLDAGAETLTEAQRSVIVVEALKPLAQTRRDIDPSVQAVKVPTEFFDALTAPVLSHLPAAKPLTGLVLPADYCTQKITPGTRIRFCETDAPMGAKLEGADGHSTGHIYESELRDAKRLKLSDIPAMVNGETAVRCGFASAHEMWEQLTTAFRRQNSPDPQNEDLLLLSYDKVKKSSWAYWAPAETPKAAYTYGGKPVPPSAYRPVARVA